MPNARGGPPAAGLCGACANARIVRNRRGSVFLLCRAAKSDPRLRKYPALPVLRCPAFRPVEADLPPDGRAGDADAPPNAWARERDAPPGPGSAGPPGDYGWPDALQSE